MTRTSSVLGLRKRLKSFVEEAAPQTVDVVRRVRRSAAARQGRVYIEDVRPQVDGGRYQAKAVLAEEVAVRATIVRDGHDFKLAVVRYRHESERRWRETWLQHDPLSDHFRGGFTADRLGVYQYRIEAWSDVFGTWARDFIKRYDVEQWDDLRVEAEVGARLIEECLERANRKQAKLLKPAVRILRDTNVHAQARLAEDDALLDVMRALSIRADGSISETLELRVDPPLAGFGAWYELFPRSAGPEGEHGTFITAAARLPHVADMGFDIVYLPPIHPIGRTHRKGKNNNLQATANDVGSPWAIGSAAGGHKAIHPQLGSEKDFKHFVRTAEMNNLKVALDFAIQCSPDHPWVEQHPEWFSHRPDGTIRYAENPPKKYQDIYPIDFSTSDAEALHEALRDVLLHWIERGVTVFRVDNPHTKSFAFWEWAIRTIKRDHPEVIFLAEAFTHPHPMMTLAKLGFTQSYTYFTWKNTRAELEDYLRELTTVHASYYRPNFFTNTPDILHAYLQKGGKPAFEVRLVLAALLSTNYGVYSGYEFCENVPVREGSEEYLDSEKYQLRHRPLDAPGSLVPLIKRINMLRRQHKALWELTNLRFHDPTNSQVMAFSKRTGDDCILCVVSLDPAREQEATLRLQLDELGLRDNEPFLVEDLIGAEEKYSWKGRENYVKLSPEAPAHIFVVSQP